MNIPHTPQDVLRYAADGRVEDWVHLFLGTVGGNQALSDGLKLQRRYWLGPALMPLDLVERCCGPEPTMEYVDDPERWEARMQRMGSALANGWAPPPLIAQFTGEIFSVRDGNHRHEALRRSGAAAYWCVVWCDSEALWHEAGQRLVRALPGVTNR